MGVEKLNVFLGWLDKIKGLNMKKLTVTNVNY